MINAPSTKARENDHIKWDPSTQGTYQLNIDRSANPKPDKGKIEGVIRDYKEKWICGFKNKSMPI